VQPNTTSRKDAWDFLKPVSILKMPDPEPKPKETPPAPAPERVAMR
jgi:hypothetical protein